MGASCIPGDLRMAHQLHTPTEYEQRLLTNSLTMGYYGDLQSWAKAKKQTWIIGNSASHTVLHYFLPEEKLLSSIRSVLKDCSSFRDFAVDLAFVFVPTSTWRTKYHKQKDCWKRNCRCLGGVRNFLGKEHRLVLQYLGFGVSHYHELFTISFHRDAGYCDWIMKKRREGVRKMSDD